MIVPIKQREERNIEENIRAKLIGLGIKNFRIKAPIVGSVITAYPIEISDSTPISKVTSKGEDIALSCGVESVDIRRIGNQILIFIPNKVRKIIDFKDSLYWFLKDEGVKKAKLPLLLGEDFQGNKSFLDLADQPHVLIAGSTGSGKSIFEINIISALTTLKEASELEVYMVDTKRVDLTLLEKLPHVKKVARDLETWYSLVEELDNKVRIRNEILERNQVRNINELNEKVSNDKKFPHVILIIDELADLIDKDKTARIGQGKDYPYPPVVLSLRRLVQICRASGLHIIACTQRTSVDIIDGVIKANFPTRISLKTASKIDSRVILDQSGAETLLGKGDLLIRRNDSDSLERFHSPFVRLEDIKEIIENREMVRSVINMKLLAS